MSMADEFELIADIESGVALGTSYANRHGELLGVMVGNECRPTPCGQSAQIHQFVFRYHLETAMSQRFLSRVHIVDHDRNEIARTVLNHQRVRLHQVNLGL